MVSLISRGVGLLGVRILSRPGWLKCTIGRIDGEEVAAKRELELEPDPVDQERCRPYEGGAAASCTLRLDDKPTDQLLSKISSHGDIIQVMLK